MVIPAYVINWPHNRSVYNDIKVSTYINKYKPLSMSDKKLNSDPPLITFNIKFCLKWHDTCHLQTYWVFSRYAGFIVIQWNRTKLTNIFFDLHMYSVYAGHWYTVIYKMGQIHQFGIDKNSIWFNLFIYI